jgi:hypothetical protein
VAAKNLRLAIVPNLNDEEIAIFERWRLLSVKVAPKNFQIVLITDPHHELTLVFFKESIGDSSWFDHLHLKSARRGKGGCGITISFRVACVDCVDLYTLKRRNQGNGARAPGFVEFIKYGRSSVAVTYDYECCCRWLGYGN